MWIFFLHEKRNLTTSKTKYSAETSTRKRYIKVSREVIPLIALFVHRVIFSFSSAKFQMKGQVFYLYS